MFVLWLNIPVYQKQTKYNTQSMQTTLILKQYNVNIIMNTLQK